MADEAPTTITLTAVETPNLDTVCLRGSAPLWALTRISQADIFDQVSNPEGLQRDLSKKHATEAYEYVARDEDPALPRAFPEVVLNVRDKRVVEVKELIEHAGTRVVTVTIDLNKIDAARSVKISRVDGNHRLFFGYGDGRERPPLDAAVPFQLHLGLSREQEESLFLDINSEQKGLNTSHLAVLRSKLTPEERELVEHPARAYAMRLATDPTSPWQGLVHMGGSKAGTKEAGEHRAVTFVALQNGVERILRKSQYISDLTTHDAQYGLIRTYWQAVKIVLPDAWEHGNDYLVLKNLGVLAWSTLGATIIDRCMAAGDVDVEDLLPYVEAAAKAVDWTKDGDAAGMSGNRAALLLAGQMAEKLPKRPRRRPTPVIAEPSTDEGYEEQIADARNAEAEEAAVDKE